MAINSMKLGLCASAWLKRTYNRHYAVLVKEFVPSGFKSHVLMMRVTGVWPTADDPSWYKWLTIAFFSFVGLLFPLSLLVNVLFANSIEEAMDYSFTSLSCWSSSFKTSMIFWQRQRVRELFRIHGRLSHGFGHNAEHHTRVAQINTRVHVYLSIVYSVTVCTNVVQSIFSKPEDAILPSTTHFPFEFAQRRAVFWSLFVCQTLCVNCLIIWTGIDDSFFIALINTTCGHLTDLKERLKSLGSDYTNADENRDLRFCKEMFGCCKQYEECSRCESIRFCRFSIIGDVNSVYIPQICRCDELIGIAGIFRSIRCQRIGFLLIDLPALGGEAFPQTFSFSRHNNLAFY